MKFVAERPFDDPDAAARKLVEIANAVEAVQDGRIYIERINGPFLDEGGTPDQFRASDVAPLPKVPESDIGRPHHLIFVIPWHSQLKA
jgi:hypothetical protein